MEVSWSGYGQKIGVDLGKRCRGSSSMSWIGWEGFNRRASNVACPWFAVSEGNVPAVRT